ncbi:hypothetical protein ES703_111226 [subsurface metagenome]
MSFGLKQREWQGPAAYEFEFYSGHTKTARYRCMLEQHAFDFYAPLFMLNVLSDEDIPDRLQMVIWKSESPVRTCGYLSEPLPISIESEVLEYEFTEVKVNSKRYDFVYEGQAYALYIPNELFGESSHPRRVYAQIAVTSEE